MTLRLRSGRAPRPLRLGLIGAGAWGKNYLKTVAALKGIEIVKVANSKDDWKKVAAAKDLDGVIIATPAALHIKMASLAVESGLPVLVEKPLGVDYQEGQALLRLAKKKKGYVLVEHTYTFHPALQALKAAAKKLGPIRSIRSLGGNKGPFRKETSVLWDYGPHDVSMCLYLMGEAPVAVRADRQEGVKGGKGENLTLRLRFKNALAELNIGNKLPARTRRMEVYFDGEALVFDDTQASALSRHKLDSSGALLKGEPIKTDVELPLTRAVKTFAAAILTDSKDLSSLDLGLAVVGILSDCEVSLSRPLR